MPDHSPLVVAGFFRGCRGREVDFLLVFAALSIGAVSCCTAASGISDGASGMAPAVSLGVSCAGLRLARARGRGSAAVAGAGVISVSGTLTFGTEVAPLFSPPPVALAATLLLLRYA